MKHIKLFNLTGMIAVITAFVLMATGAVFEIGWLFITGAIFLLIGILLTVVLPGLTVAKWTKLMIDHGVPATAVIIKTEQLPRSSDILLTLKVTDNDMITTCIITKGNQENYKLDSLWNIKYDPKNTEYCIITNELKPNDDINKTETD